MIRLHDHHFTAVLKSWGGRRSLQRRQYRLSGLLNLMVLAGMVFGAVHVFLHPGGPWNVEDLWERKLAAFRGKNPESLESWSILVYAAGRPLIWEQNGIEYWDRDGDGLPDKKYATVMNYHVAWIDGDRDGTFEVEVQQGHYDYHVEYVHPPVEVPRPAD